MNITINMSMH